MRNVTKISTGNNTAVVEIYNPSEGGYYNGYYTFAHHSIHIMSRSGDTRLFYVTITGR